MKICKIIKNLKIDGFEICELIENLEILSLTLAIDSVLVAVLEEAATSSMVIAFSASRGEGSCRVGVVGSPWAAVSICLT